MEQKTFSFDKLPHSAEELKAFPEAELTDPFAVAALTVLAFCAYGTDTENCIEMLNVLKGPQPVSAFEKQFYHDRLGYNNAYVPFSYLEGSSPENGYTPAEPYTVTVFDNPYSYKDENYAALWLKSSGADSPREIKLRKKPSAGKWYLLDQMILGSIREPKEGPAADPWA